MVIEKNKLKIDIFDDQYCLVSDEKEEDIVKASHLVDTLMREIANKSSLHDGKKIAVLSALRIASKLINFQNSLQNCENKQKELVNIIEKKGLSSSF